MDTYLTIEVKAPQRMHKPIRWTMDNVAGDVWEEQERDGNLLRLRRHTRYADVDTIAAALDELMDEGSEEHDLPPSPFAYDVYTEPTDEGLGLEVLRVPTGDGGFIDFSAECDEGGLACLDWHAIETATQGIEDPADKWAAVVEAFGQHAYGAYGTYQPTELPEQLTLDAAAE